MNKRDGWRKLGCIFEPNGNTHWMKTHAANPVARNVEGDLFQVFFSGRNEQNQASIGYFLININSPRDILEISSNPVVSPGPLGCFDDSGTSMGCIVPHEGRFYLYYLGWNLGVTVPWRNSIGLAISDDGFTFEKHSLAPIFDRNAIDPYSISYPYVIIENAVWKMWYGSNLQWGKNQEDMMHIIKYAESSNGLNWTPSGTISINIEDKSEYAFSKPSIIKMENNYRMWYSFRGDAYRIGYAESTDGIQFHRKDNQAGIDVSPEGWDSETIEYPNVVQHNGNLYMFYNGNQYGRTGVGLAVLEDG